MTAAAAQGQSPLCPVARPTLLDRDQGGTLSPIASPHHTERQGLRSPSPALIRRMQAPFPGLQGPSLTLISPERGSQAAACGHRHG